jgi:hypothetical protein
VSAYFIPEAARQMFMEYDTGEGIYLRKEPL